MATEILAWLRFTMFLRELVSVIICWSRYYSACASPLIPAQDAARFLPMFGQLLERDGFAGKWGLTTAERRHRCYNYVSTGAGGDNGIAKMRDRREISVSSPIISTRTRS
jgi:hypothetical protein